jgi:AraC family transcriptional regulator
MILRSGTYMGETIRRVDVAGLILTENRYGPGTALRTHGHEGSFFCLVVGGTFEEGAGRTVRACTPGTLLYHPAGDVHSDHFGRHGGRTFSLELGPSWARRINDLEADERPAPGPQSGLASAMARRVFGELGVSRAASTLEVEGWALLLVAEAGRGSHGCRRRPRWLDSALEFLDAHFREPVRLADVAAAARVHPVHLARAFRSHRGCTVGEHVRRLRIGWASHEIAKGERSLAEIALAAGFADQGHFTRTFRRVLGDTPTAFLRRVRR